MKKNLLKQYQQLNKGLAKTNTFPNFTSKLTIKEDLKNLSFIAPVFLGGAFSMLAPTAGLAQAGGCGGAAGVAWNPTGGGQGEGSVELGDGGNAEFIFSVYAGGANPVFARPDGGVSLATNGSAGNGAGASYPNIKQLPGTNSTILPGTQAFNPGKLATGVRFLYLIRQNSGAGDNPTDFQLGEMGYIGVKDGNTYGFVHITMAATTIADNSTPCSVDINMSGLGNADGNVEVADCGSLNLLPVELISFFAKKEGRDVNLTWKTASEINNAGFEVLRSENGKDFNRIGWVDGFGNSNALQEYDFVDKGLTAGKTYYYQLKQVDFDGQSEKSMILTTVIEGAVTTAGNFYPNPSKEAVNLDFSATTENEWTANIYNGTGQLVQTTSFHIVEGSNKVQLNVSALNSGKYFVKFENGQDRIYKQLSIQK